MKKIIPTLALILTANVAYAEPVYLNCNIPDSVNVDFRNFSVTLDEATGKVSQAWEKYPGSSFNTNAIYSPDSISYKGNIDRGPVSVTEDTYIIDRATLSIKKSAKAYFEHTGETKTFVSPGQCTKAEVVKGNKI
jgi:hypothetical protein